MHEEGEGAGATAATTAAAATAAAATAAATATTRCGPPSASASTASAALPSPSMDSMNMNGAATGSSTPGAPFSITYSLPMPLPQVDELPPTSLPTSAHGRTDGGGSTLAAGTTAMGTDAPLSPRHAVRPLPSHHGLGSTAYYSSRVIDSGPPLEMFYTAQLPRAGSSASGSRNRSSRSSAAHRNDAGMNEHASFVVMSASASPPMPHFASGSSAAHGGGGMLGLSAISPNGGDHGSGDSDSENDARDDDERDSGDASDNETRDTVDDIVAPAPASSAAVAGVGAGAPMSHSVIDWTTGPNQGRKASSAAQGGGGNGSSGTGGGGGGGSGAKAAPLSLRQCCTKVRDSCSSFFLSFVGVLAISSALSIAIACVIVILLWHSTAKNTVGDLSADYRDKILMTVKGNIERQMLEPLYVLENLDQWTSIRFGNFTGISNIAMQDGFLSMVSLQRQLYPALSTIGCGTDSGMLFSAQHPNKSVATARPDRGNVYIYTTHASGASPAIGPDGRMSDEFTVGYYQLPEPNPSTPNHVSPDFLHTDAAASITARLGSPINTIPNYITRTRNFFVRGLAVANLSNRDTGWATPSGTPVTVDLTLTAVKPGRARIPTRAIVGDGADGVGSGAAGRPYFHCYATILMTQVDEILRVFPLGARGRAFVFASNGKLIASTLYLSAAERSGTNVFYANEFSLQVPSSILIEKGLAVADAADPSLGAEVPYVAPFHTEEEVDGTVYDMRAAQLNIPGLNWFLIVYTSDGDYDGGLDDAVRTTSILSGVVVVGALILTVLLSRLLTRPLLRVSTLMEEAVVAIGMEKGRKQRRALRKLNVEFERQTGLSVDEVAQSGRHNQSRASANDFAAGGARSTSDVQQLSSRRPGGAGAGAEASLLRGSRGTSPSVLAKRSLQGRPPAGGENGVEMHALVPAGADGTAAGPLDLEAQKDGNHSGQQQQPTLAARARVAKQPAQSLPWWRRWFCCCRSQGSSSVASHRHTSGRRSGAPKSKGCCLSTGTSSLHEVALMHRSIGSILFALTHSDQLEHINQAKRAFIRYVFHEVRVPFNAIVLGAEQLQLHCAALRGEHAQDIRDVTHLIAEQATVVARILNDVLSMQKIEDGGLALAPEAFDLAGMVRVTLASFREQLQAKHLTLVSQLPPVESMSFARGLPEGTRLLVYGDRYRLRQVLSNFLSNAIAYSPPFGTVTVRIDMDESSFVPASGASALRTGRTTISHSPVQQYSRRLSQGQQPLSQPQAQQGGGVAAAAGGVAAAAGSAGNTQSQSLRPDNTRIPGRSNIYLTASSLVDRPHGSGVGGGSVVSNAVAVSSAMSGGPAGKERVSASEHSSSGSGGGTMHLHPPPLDPLSRSHTPSSSQQLFGTCTFRVSVSDTGPGIPAEHQSKIFSAYKQVQSARIQLGRGTGLGLQISRSIIELHGGRIGFLTQPLIKRGTEFYFSLSLPLLAASRSSNSVNQLDDPEDGGPDGDKRDRDGAGAAGGDGDHGDAAGDGAQSRSGGSGHARGRASGASSEEVASVHFHDTEFDTCTAVYADMKMAEMREEDSTAAAVWPTPRVHEETREEAAATVAAGAAPLNLNGSGSFPARSGGGASSTSSAASKPPPVKPRVLVVEDSTPNRKLLMSLLRLLNCDVVGAEHGRIAVDLFSDCFERPTECPVPFDVVLMDGSMPVMSGLEATAYLRARGITLPVLAVTGNALAEDVQAFLRSGADSVLTKPINRAMLVHALHKYLPPHLATLIPHTLKRAQARRRCLGLAWVSAVRVSSQL